VGSATSFGFTPTSGVTATIDANGAGSITFNKLTYLNAVSGAVQATDSGTISWTCTS
jgi:spore coat protein U-like protein